MLEIQGTAVVVFPVGLSGITRQDVGGLSGRTVPCSAKDPSPWILEANWVATAEPMSLGLTPPDSSGDRRGGGSRPMGSESPTVALNMPGTDCHGAL